MEHANGLSQQLQKYTLPLLNWTNRSGFILIPEAYNFFSLRFVVARLKFQMKKNKKSIRDSLTDSENDDEPKKNGNIMSNQNDLVSYMLEVGVHGGTLLE